MKATLVFLCAAIGCAIALPRPKAIREFPTRIVGGSVAERGQFPYQVQIQDSQVHSCGGAILNANWIVTAAHCATKLGLYYTVVVNQYNIYVNEGTERKYSVSRVVRHPNFNADTLEHDIALMRVSSPIVLDELAQTIRIPGVSEAPTPGEKATVSGWGILTEGGANLPLYLHYVAVPIVSRETCTENYAQDGLPIHRGMLCAGQTEGGRDSCNGDSGGPLVCPDSGKGQYLCGIVSWGLGCARPEKPGVYTEVAYYSQWIQTTIIA